MAQTGYSLVEGDSGQAPYGDPLRDLRLLTVDDVCSLLKVKKSWLYDTVESGAIEVVRLGKQLRFQPSALSDYLARSARHSKPE